MEMEQSKKFIFVGNDPALDLLNTTPVLAEGPADFLESFSDLVAWLAQAGLIPEQESAKLQREKISSSEAHAALKQAKSLREALRAIVIAIENDASIPKSAMTAMNDVLRAAAGYSELSWNPRDNRFEANWQPSNQTATSRVLAALSRAVVKLLTERDLRLIRKCENPACVLHYYDTSKNHSRRWCSMDVCGNRMKVASHYRRHRGDKNT